tara:strand:- start:4214 stop:5086 length:873 start_codon:yes stop_codon:yes gene_type:complete
MNKKNLVSTIIPTFNRAELLKEALDSVMEQTVSSDELIVVDDGSEDGTETIVSSIAKAAYYKLMENKGVSFARNYGVSRASGRYICFLDSDDRWLPQKLEAQLEWMESHPDCQICYTDEIWIRRGVRVNEMNKHRKVSGDVFRNCLPLCIVSPSSVMIRADFFRKVGGFDESLPACEDYDLWLRMSLLEPFYLINRKLIVKRGGHDDQLSRKYWGMDRFRVYALIKLLENQRLNGEKELLVRAILREKCDILCKGFAKRGKITEVEYYRNLIEANGPLEWFSESGDWSFF